MNPSMHSDSSTTNDNMYDNKNFAKKLRTCASIIINSIETQCKLCYKDDAECTMMHAWTCARKFYNLNKTVCLVP